MWNYPIISSFFIDKIGFRQTLDPCIPKIHPDLLSGVLFVPDVKDCGSFLKSDYIYNAINELSSELQSKFDIWSNSTNYAVNDRVRYTIGSNTFVYVCTAANINNTPVFDSAFWETDLSSYLRNIFDTAIKEKVPQVVNLNSIRNNLRDNVIYSPLLEEKTQNEVGVPYSTDKFFTIAVKLDSLRNSKMVVSHIGLRVKEPQTIPIYLYHSSQPENIQVENITISIANADKFIWHKLANPFEIWYYSDLTNASGMWLIGFYQSDLIGDFYTNRVYYKSQTFEHLSFKNNIGFIDSPQLNKPFTPNVGFTYSNIAPMPDFNFNIRYSLNFDYTYLIIDAAPQFYKLLQYEIAYRIISDMQFSKRINIEKSTIEAKINRILNGSFLENGKTVSKGLSDYISEFETQIELNLGYLGKNPFELQFG